MATHPGCIAVLNAGSSSIKFALYEPGADGGLLLRGQVERIGQAPRLEAKDAAGKLLAERTWSDGNLDHEAATAEIMALGRELLHGRPVLGLRSSCGAWRHGLLRSSADRRQGAGQACRAGAARAAAPAAQSGADPRHRAGGAAPAAGRLLRHRLPPQPAGAGAGLRAAARDHGGGRAALRLPWPVLRLHRHATEGD